MTEKEARERERRVRFHMMENARQLQGCTRHQFKAIDEKQPPLLQLQKCVYCAGKVTLSEKRWYEQGIQDAEKELTE